MSFDEHRETERRGRRQRRRDERRRRRQVREPSAEERAYLEARRVAEAKVRLLGDLVPFAVVSLLLVGLLVATKAKIFLFLMLVPVLWALRLYRRYYRIGIAPSLRERFVEEEVRKRVRDTLQRERRALAGEHSRSMEELSASIAHEIRNPITAAKSLVQQMGEDTAARENVEYAKVALEELSRVERSVSHLLRFARDEELQRAEIVLADVVESALETFRDRIDRGGVQVLLRADAESRLEADPGKLRRVLINLVGNALDALEQSPPTQPELAIETGENLAGSAVWIRVRDNGPGVDEEASRKLFEPFFTSKPGGTGLGLAITRKLVEAHGGSIELARAESGDSEFLVTLPKRPPAEGGES